MKKLAKMGWAAGVEVLGWLVLFLGIAMMILPGPGIIGVFLGLVILSNRYTWAKKLRDNSKEKVVDAAESSVATKKRIAFSCFMALCVMALGVYLAQDPRLPKELHFELLGLEVGPYIPGAGLFQGVVMVISSIVALGTLFGAWYKFRKKKNED